MGSICASFTCKLPAISTEDVIIAAFKYMSIFIKYAGSIFPTGFSTNFAKKALGLDPQHKISAWESEGGRKLKARSIFIEHEKVPITLANGPENIIFPRYFSHEILFHQLETRLNIGAWQRHCRLQKLPKRGSFCSPN